MAKRLFNSSMWSDAEFEDFDYDEKYFWFYLLTNSYNNICGISRVGIITIAREMGTSKDHIERMIDIFENKRNLIIRDKETNEFLIKNWRFYFWTTSEDLKSSILKQLNDVRSEKFKRFILTEVDKIEWVPNLKNKKE